MDRIRQKLNGYRASHRNKWLFIKEGVLSLQELSLLEFYADIFVFDCKKSDFGLVQVNFQNIAEFFGCGETTIRGWHKKLEQVGFILKTSEKGIYRLACYERYINPGLWKGRAAEFAISEKEQSTETILQNFGISFQSTGKKFQQNEEITTVSESNSGSIAIVSSKDNSKYIYQPTKSLEEYDETRKQGNYQLLTADDMRWIDENLPIKITDELFEKDVVDSLFEGDWEKYRQALIHQKKSGTINASSDNSFGLFSGRIGQDRKELSSTSAAI